MPEPVVVPVVEPVVVTPVVTPIVPAAPEWLNTMPDEIKNDTHVQKYKTVDEYYRAEKSQRELIGRKGVIIPTDKSTPEEWDKYYTDLGRPKEAKEYKLTNPENLHKAIQITPEFNARFTSVVHKLGLNQKQADMLYQDYLQDASLVLTDREGMAKQAREAGAKALREEWGKDYDRNFALAGKVVKGFGGDAFLQELGDLGSKPAVVKMFATIGNLISEDRIPDIAGGGGGGNLSDSEKARKEIDAALQDPKSPYRDGSHKDHAAAVQKITELYKIAHNTK